MIKLEKLIQVERKTDKLVFLNATNSQMKTKGIKGEVEIVKNRITDVSVVGTIGTLSRSVLFELQGQLGGELFKFTITNEAFFTFIKEVSIINGKFASAFMAYFNGLVSEIIPEKSSKYKAIEEMAILAPARELKAKEEAKAKATQELEYTKKAMAAIKELEIVKINGSQLAIYLGHKTFAYYRRLQRKNTAFTKRGYGFFFIDSLEDVSNMAAYKNVVIDRLSTVESLNIFADLKKAFKPILNKREKSFVYVASRLTPPFTHLHGWALQSAEEKWTSRVIYNFAFYSTASNKAKDTKEKFIEIMETDDLLTSSQYNPLVVNFTC